MTQKLLTCELPLFDYKKGNSHNDCQSIQGDLSLKTHWRDRRRIFSMWGDNEMSGNLAIGSLKKKNSG